nr:reverse transcriptase domain-containing protein [Tanacetum cinerariifolium]
DQEKTTFTCPYGTFAYRRMPFGLCNAPAISSEVSELKDLVRALLLDKKNQSSAPAQSSTPTPVKAIEPNYVTCGGAHSYQNYLATSVNVYQDNIQDYVSQAAAANYNQGNTDFRPQMVANQMRPPGFSPYQNHQNNFNQGNNFNQNRGGNFNQSNFNQGGNFNQGQLHRPQGQNVQNQCQGLQTQIANLTDMLSKFVSSNTASSSGSGTLPSNTVTNPKEDLKGITTRSGVAYQGPTIPTQSKVMKQGTEVTKDQVQTPSSQSTAPVQPPVIQSETQTPIFEPVVAPVSVPIPYPSRRDNERRRDQANEQIEKFYEIFKEMSFEISFTDALILMPKFASTLKALIRNKEKLRMDECLALADLGASINLMPLSVWEGLLLSELTPTCMTLELADRSVSKPIGIAEDVSVKVGVFHFSADFVVVDFKPDPRVPLILRRCFLKTGRALIDVHKGELTLRIRNEAITYNLDQTVRYSANYNQMTANKIDVICEIYSQEILGFSDVTASGNPTPYDDPIVSTTSPTLTPFGDSDFLLFEEADAFLGLEDDPDSPKINPFYYDPEGDILLLEAILNSEPLPPFPNHKLYMPSYKKELKVCEAKTVKSSVDKPPEVELKYLPPHLEYAFLEGDNKFPVIIAKELGDEEKSALIKILMEEDYKPAVQHQRRVNPKIHDVIKKEIEKLLDAGLIYPISDSPWVSLVHCVPKKGGFTVIKNEENELIPTHLVTGWRVCIDYRKLNEATRKDHFPLPFMDKMLERLARNKYYCFLDGFSGCMLAIFHDMVEKTMEVFMDDFSIFWNSFENCLSHLDKMLQRCENTNLSLNWEKSHFMVKEGIVLGHKISRNEIDVDRAKVDVIAKSPHPTTVKAKALPTNDARVVCKFLKSLFARFGSPRAIISDRGTHFCNDQFAKVMLKYGVTHRFSIAYHPQTSGQVEVSNHDLKRILERTIGENRASWSDKLDDSLWAFRTTYKTPIGCTPYKLVYGKACHLPIEHEHKAYWALKQANFDLVVAGDHRKVQMNELNELCDHAYENSLIYKEKTKRIHDTKIKNRVFNDCLDCEVSRALSFCLSFTRASHPQLHFGNTLREIEILVFLGAYFIALRGDMQHLSMGDFAMLLKKLPERLRDPGKFLIPCDLPGMDVCHALADLGASINLMPLSIWKKLSLPELTPTRMTLDLADRSVTRPKGVAKDVFIKVGKFHFLTDFVVVDFEADPCVPLILGRSFLRTSHALIDVYEEEITLRVNDKAITFNLNQTMRYSSTYDDLSVNRIDIIDVAREEYAQEILGFSLGGNPTSTFELILFDSYPSLTPFVGSDLILEEIDAYLKDESISLEIDHADYDP